MDIRVQGIYSLEWSSSFESTFNGIYEVLAILTYPEALNVGADIKKDVYTRCNVEAQFDTDLTRIRDDDILKLRNVNDDSIVHLPSILLSKIPNANVAKYSDIAMAINLGLFTDATTLETVKSDIEEILRARLGISDSILLYTVKDKWMTEADYNAVVDFRLTAAGGEFDRGNHYVDKLELQKALMEHKTRIKEYEDLLIALDTEQT